MNFNICIVREGESDLSVFYFVRRQFSNVKIETGFSQKVRKKGTQLALMNIIIYIVV